MMAMIGVLTGSVLGFFAALLGWSAFGMPILSAFALYICTALGMMALTCVIRKAYHENAPARHMPQT